MLQLGAGGGIYYWMRRGSREKKLLKDATGRISLVITVNRTQTRALTVPCSTVEL